MATAATTPPLHVFRSLLRHIKSIPKQTFPKEFAATTSTTTAASTTSRNPLAEHVLKEYKACKDLSPSSSRTIQLRKMAYNFHILKKDLTERGRLHELDGGAEVKLTPKELSR
eukprot:323567_1